MVSEGIENYILNNIDVNIDYEQNINKLANKNIEINEEDNKLSTLISKVQNLPTNK